MSRFTEAGRESPPETEMREQFSSAARLLRQGFHINDIGTLPEFSLKLDDPQWDQKKDMLLQVLTNGYIGMLLQTRSLNWSTLEVTEFLQLTASQVPSSRFVAASGDGSLVGLAMKPDDASAYNSAWMHIQKTFAYLASLGRVAFNDFVHPVDNDFLSLSIEEALSFWHMRETFDHYHSLFTEIYRETRRAYEQPHTFSYEQPLLRVAHFYAAAFQI